LINVALFTFEKNKKEEKKEKKYYEVLYENEISFFKKISGGCAPRPRAPRPPAGGHLASLVA